MLGVVAIRDDAQQAGGGEVCPDNLRAFVRVPLGFGVCGWVRDVVVRVNGKLLTHLHLCVLGSELQFVVAEALLLGLVVVGFVLVVQVVLVARAPQVLVAYHRQSYQIGSSNYYHRSRMDNLLAKQLVPDVLVDQHSLL